MAILSDMQLKNKSMRGKHGNNFKENKMVVGININYTES